MSIEAGRLVSPSGNLQIGGQQTWLGPALAGRQVTIWAGETVVHILLDGTRLKALPSLLGVIEVARLAADGARPAGPPSLRAGTGTAVEVERMVNGIGLIGLAGRQFNVGYDLAGQRVTLRTAPRWPFSATKACSCAPGRALSRPPAGTGYAEPAAQLACQHPPADR
ncbi:MAG: hypothetical protein WBQ71_22160 [Trebonia sp.]